LKRRLILFSGGVESTALLTIADKKDLLLICGVPRKNYTYGLDYAKCKKIASVYGNEIMEFDFPNQIDGSKWTNQLMWFVFTSYLIVASRDDINEVWWGMHYNESHRNFNHPIERKKNFERIMTAWYTLHPTIKFWAPLEFETKTQQWQRIPDDVKKYVSWCNTNNDCGVCRKCLEFKKYCGDIPKNRPIFVPPKKELKEVQQYSDSNGKKFLSNFLNIKGNA